MVLRSAASTRVSMKLFIFILCSRAASWNKVSVEGLLRAPEGYASTAGTQQCVVSPATSARGGKNAEGNQDHFVKLSIA